jgi:hypothetical protein
VQVYAAYARRASRPEIARLALVLRARYVRPRTAQLGRAFAVFGRVIGTLSVRSGTSGRAKCDVVSGDRAAAGCAREFCSKCGVTWHVRKSWVGVPCQPAVAPGEHGEGDVVVVEAFLGESVFVADGPGLVFDFGEDVDFDEASESSGQDVGCDVETSLEVVEPTRSEEALADDQPAPPIAGDGQRPRDGRGAVAFEELKIG